MICKEILQWIDDLRPFYHCIEILSDEGNRVYTPGEPYFEVWGNIRKARAKVNYQDKLVLDLATFDGLWAFEAEKLGALLVVATDCNWEAQKRFLFCREALRSSVVPVFGVPVHELVRRLDFYLKGANVRWTSRDPHPGLKWNIPDPKFDIVQHLGLFYHLRDPLQSLLQCRSVIKDGGILLVETGFLKDENRPVMVFNDFRQPCVYNDCTTWWAPSLSCLNQVLAASCFEVFGDPAILEDPGNPLIGRVCLTARAVPMDQADPRLVSELHNTYRTPGLEL